MPSLVFITGASSGIGQSLAWRYYQAGFSLALVARRTAEIQAWAEERGLQADRFAVYDADVAHSDSIVAAAQSRSARQCRDAKPASQCYEFAMFEALGRSGHLSPFAKWTCRHVRCEEMSICSVFPHPK